MGDFGVLEEKEEEDVSPRLEMHHGSVLAPDLYTEHL